MNKPSVPLAVSLAALFACAGPLDLPDESGAAPTSIVLSIVGVAETTETVGVTARGSDGNVPANVLDGDLSTRWSCEGVGCWIRADLGEQKPVTGLAVAWFVGDERTNDFTISVSSDDSAYTTVFAGKSSGTTLQLEPYAISATPARYVKLTVNGNSDSAWASVTELQVFGVAPTPYVGCYTDSPTRALPKVLAWSNATVESCTAAAKSQSFAYAGLQYGGECWAGNAPGATKVADSECAMPCTANSSEICGGPWRNSVYSTATGPTVCTSFTYTDWGPCQPNSAQTRTLVSQSPAGCSGGNPVLTQGCIPAAAQPVIRPASRTSSMPIAATITCPTSGTLPYHTTDGSAPTTSSTQSASTTLTRSGTLRAICAGEGRAPSAETSATYAIRASGGGWVATDGASPCTNRGTTACQYASCWNEPMHTGNACGAAGDQPCRIFYVCDCGSGADGRCAGHEGNDSNDGTSPLTPWRSVSNAKFSALAAGETLALCRGGSIGGGGSRWGNTRGTAANPILLRDYVAPWNTGAEGRPTMSALSFDPVVGVRATNIDFVGGGGCGTATDLTLCNTVWRDAGDSGFYEGGAATAGIRVKAIGSLFLNNHSQGWLGSGQQTEIRSSYFYNNGINPMLGGGVGGMFGHSLYLGGGESAGEIVAGNEFHPPAGAGGTTVGIHGTHRDMLFENNLIVSDIGPVGNSNYGIGAIPGYQPRLEYNTNAIFRGNTIINAGGHSIAVAICQNCLVENNLVINTQRATSGIMFPERMASGSEHPTTASTIRNNTIYLTAGGTGIQVGGEGTGHVVANNVVQSDGTCYGWGGSPGDFAERDYNASTRCGDAVVGSHSWKADPMWGAPGSNFHPSAAPPASPLIGAGDSSQNPGIDITGVARQVPPSIGAYDR
jgi:hypothetical protein